MINEISIILPALDEDYSLPLVVNELIEEFETLDLNYEIIIVDDGSVNSVKNYLQESEKLKIFSNQYSRGQSYSLFKGFEEAQYKYLATLDSDGQNPPDELIKLIDCFNENFDACDIVSGYREKRKDGIIRLLYSKFANFIIRILTKSSCKDLGCALKVFKKEMLNDINYTGDIHRILTPLFEYRGYKLLQVSVNHNPRVYGNTKYGFSRINAVIIDALLIYLTKGFTLTPRYTLGRLSLYFGMISVFLFLLSLYQKFYLDIFVHRNPLFLIGITTLFIFFQLLFTAIISFFIENK